MFRLIAILFALGLVTVSAHAQDAYHLTPPPGWTVTKVENGTLQMTPPGPSDAVVLVMPPEPLEADFSAQAAKVRAKYESAMSLRDPGYTAPQQGQSSAGEYFLIGGTYTALQNGRNVPLHLLFYARGGKGAFGFAIFITGSAENYGLHGPAATAMFNSMQLTDAAKQIAATRIPAPNAPSQGGNASDETAAKRQQLYNQCVQDCGGRMMICYTGPYRNGTTSFVNSCAQQNLNCQMNCSVFK